ncbi:GlsB/YeaQ/YmgE family stress response membrane protein [Rhodobacteraceae bacterium 2CG4]|uniref:GlsB/YeaQ/YmgE family stress response membrane protein n=1 Tax=Halovulum marinum TaxID=2662447 RepID=A0A6L5YVH3_9RHOB|nr:GlsB/YeaQ/YmgE family stress response membrane protein [Halovulum marinum]MSU88247.1 GlsB/YeaQ/YmgE family stress response membrane protein [Halovulum marinum]
MSGIGWIGAIIIGGLAGWVAEKVMNADHGLLTNILLGIAGALVLNAILGLLLGGTLGGWIGQFIVALVGAILLIWGWRMLRARSS